MRLLKLQIKNFISIKQASIDFSELNDGVFLISGPTGSGKSSMLDAIHWVLFGKTLSTNRAAITKEIRSTYAPITEDSAVSLTFIQDRIEYKVIRTLKKDGGTAVQLFTPDAIYDKVKDVNDRLEKIIGLTVKQFDQMVMLEQGNFSKFLLADSKTRAEVLRDIFDTQLFKDIELRFKDKCSELKNAITNSVDLEHNLLQGELLETIQANILLTAETIQTEQSRLAELKEEHDKVQAILPDMVAYDQEYAVYKKAQQDLAELEKLKVEVDILYKKRDVFTAYAGILDWYDNYLKLKGDLDKAQLDIADYQARIANVVVDEELSNKVENLRQRQGNLNSMLDLFDNCTRYKEQIEQYTNELDKLAEQHNSINQELLDKTQNLTELKDRIERRQAYDNACSAVMEQDKKKIQIQEEINKLEQFIQDNKPVYTKLLANRLIEMSDEGVCPICGAPYSIEHAESEAASGSLDLKQRELENKKNQLEGFKVQLDQMVPMPMPECTEAITFDELTTQWKSLDSTVSALSQSLQSLSSKISMIEGSLSAAKDELARIEPDIAGKKKSDVESELAQVTTEYSELWAKVDANEMAKRSKNLLEGYLKSVQDKKEKLVQELDTINNHPDARLETDTELKEAKQHREDIVDYKTNINTYLYKIQHYEMLHDSLLSVVEPTNPHPGYTADSCKQIITDTNIGIEEAIHRISEYQGSLDSRKDLVKRVQDIRVERDKNTKLYDENAYIYNLVSGKNNSRISFETFVLHRQLEWILNASNQYLHTLSAGQFELNVKWEAASARTQGGLEITITDHFTGSSRPAQTFSGGELFMLSLSLSLGLMTAIDSLFTARDLNLLFVDEGFGSLDQECLNRTLLTLRELKNIKMVGIISHVQELIDTIPQGLLVDKTTTGSRFRMFKNN